MPELAYTSNNTNSVERIMPQDIDAEKAVLAAMLFADDAEVAEEAMMKLSAKEFYRPAHQKIFEAMTDLYNSRIPIDQLSLADRLKARGDLDAIGGKPYIVELGNSSFAIANWANHADIIKRTAMLRNLINAGVRITALAYDAPDDMDEVVEASEKLLLDVTNKRVASNFQSAESLILETYTNLQELASNKTIYNGVRTGFRDLDDLFGGLRAGDLVILAARPAIGKTAFALNIASRAAQLGTTVAFFSLEMAAQQLIQRVLASEAEIDSKRLQLGNMKQQEWERLASVSNRLSGIPLWVDETPGTSILELRAKARRKLRGVEPGKGLIIVDYLQLMQPQRARTESRQVEIAEISRGLKILAKEMQIPIIALAQLSREVEKRPNKRPLLSDLRESGAIEQDADIVMFLDRSKDEREAAEEGRPAWRTADVIVAKHRNGETGQISLSFESRFTKFENLGRPDDREFTYADTEYSNASGSGY